jgi:hypothetical protein
VAHVPRVLLAALGLAVALPMLPVAAPAAHADSVTATDMTKFATCITTDAPGAGRGTSS